MEKRFSWLFEIEPKAARPLWDRVVVSDGRAKSIPSKGSIVPGWVLTFATRETVNLKDLNRDERGAVLTQAECAAEVVAKLGGRVFQFEHGAGKVGSVVGCGLDIAHLHTVPLSFDLIEAVQRRAGDTVTWRAVSELADPWSEIRADEYIVVRELATGRAIIGEVRVPTSQLVRKVIASEMGVSDNWDYRTFPGHLNVEATVQAFRADAP